ncbi:MAG: c-type cytochrome domain-containing protein, partial [Pirellulales bacterium]
MNVLSSRTTRPLFAVLLLLFPSAALADDAQPIAIAEVTHEGPVDFEKEILPILAKSCTACHNASAAESDLVLETPQTILKGGLSGPAVVPGKSGESLLLKAAAHLEEPFMPPADNSVEAAPLSSEQLGLIKLWIDQGATGEVGVGAAIAWQSLPAGMNPIYAVAMSPDAQLAACSRANQIFIYNLASGAQVTRLTDAALVESGLYKQQGVAHLDLVQSLAFSPDGNLLASGGYREVKLWRRPHDVRRAELPPAASAVQAIAVSPDGKLAAIGEASGEIKLWDLATLKDPKLLAGHTAATGALQFLPDGSRLISGSQDKSVRVWNVADGAVIAQVETPA